MAARPEFLNFPPIGEKFDFSIIPPIGGKRGNRDEERVDWRDFAGHCLASKTVRQKPALSESDRQRMPLQRKFWRLRVGPREDKQVPRPLHQGRHCRTGEEVRPKKAAKEKKSVACVTVILDEHPGARAKQQSRASRGNEGAGLGPSVNDFWGGGELQLNSPCFKAVSFAHHAPHRPNSRDLPPLLSRKPCEWRANCQRYD